MGMRVSYLVCATPRSGSTLLCEGLKATGVAGRPEEYFEADPRTGRPRTPADFLAGLDDQEAQLLIGSAQSPEPPAYSSLFDVERHEDHLARVRAWGTTANGVFGAKVMWGHVDDPGALFPGASYVWVRRRDPSARRSHCGERCRRSRGATRARRAPAAAAPNTTSARCGTS
jgi:LPS sulfotransferase NodH